MIEVTLFGKFAVRDADGKEIALAGAKTQGLMAFLAMTMELPPTRDRIITLFWGDRFSDQARQSLRQAIAKLRRTLPTQGPDVLIVDNDRIGLNPDAVRVDVDQFGVLAASDDPDAVLQAVALMQGPLLDGFYGQQPAFEDWIASERQRINEVAATAMERASNIFVQRGAVDDALRCARRLTEIEPWSDAAQMVLLRLLAQTGSRPAAIQAFKAYETT